LFTVKLFFWVIAATLMLVSIGNLVASVYTSIVVGIYPTTMRYTGVALVYNLEVLRLRVG